ncbi:hypothetical protein AA313_de0207692 [Arthrobotrys entomopaga]|nr:hypothetical protein AA313_de0207692 [Arthrobotrys entomopaga]
MGPSVCCVWLPNRTEQARGATQPSARSQLRFAAPLSGACCWVGAGGPPCSASPCPALLSGQTQGKKKKPEKKKRNERQEKKESQEPSIFFLLRLETSMETERCGRNSED